MIKRAARVAQVSCIVAVSLLMTGVASVQAATVPAVGTAKVQKYITHGRYYTQKVELEDVIPVPEDIQALTRDKKGAIADLIDRIEAYYEEQGFVSEDLQTWLTKHKHIRREFWLAIHPNLDDAQAVIAFFDNLRTSRSDTFEEYFHLAIAMSVVADTATAIESSRHFLVWGVEEKQFLSRPELLEIYDHFTNKKNAKLFPYSPKVLVWPLLVHLVDLDLNESERNWGIKRFAQMKTSLEKTYSQIDYDYEKLNQRPRLGTTRPYSLANIFNPAIGGVCVDQAYCSSRVMKTFGIPALKVRGDGRYGGMGHAWTGYLARVGSRLSFDFTGRFNNDYFYTGMAFDPQTETLVLDRHIAMMLDGALKNYEKYTDAAALTRIGNSIYDKNVKAAQSFAETAIKSNPLYPHSWRLLFRCLLTTDSDTKVPKKHMKSLFKELSGHPDLSLELMDYFMKHWERDDTKTRQKYYEAAFALYAKRPDLQLLLRTAQCKELFADGNAKDALQKAARTATDNATEGTLVLPLVEIIVDACKDSAKWKRPAYAVLNGLTKKGFPQRRGNEVSQAYLDLTAMIEQLR